MKYKFWNILHNLIAHPLLVTGTKLADTFHDWSAEKMIAKDEKYDGIGIRPIHTTCNCGENVTMNWNGNWHSANCKCGRNIRQKQANIIIDRI